jgi:hypothetical protein
MVSPLSSRILNLEAKARIKNYRPAHHQHDSPPSNRNQSWQVKKDKRHRISGYSADAESKSFVVNMDKQNRAAQVEAQANKRRKLDLDFQAFNVRKDLANAGIQCNPGLVGRSRALPAGSIDMRFVRLVTVSKDSPYDEEEDLEDSPVPQYTNYISDYTSVLKDCQQFYTQLKQGHRIKCHTPYSLSGSETTSSSSTPLSESDNEEDSSFAIPAKVFTSNNGTIRCCNEMLSEIISKSDSKYLTMESALEATGTARLVVKVNDDNTIVHASASFSELSGTPSHLLIGSPLQKFLSWINNAENGSVNLLVPDKEAANTNTGSDDISIFYPSLTESKACNLTISQIAAPFKDGVKPHVDYIAVDFTIAQDTSEADADADLTTDTAAKTELGKGTYAPVIG